VAVGWLTAAEEAKRLTNLRIKLEAWITIRSVSGYVLYRSRTARIAVVSVETGRLAPQSPESN